MPAYVKQLIRLNDDAIRFLTSCRPPSQPKAAEASIRPWTRTSHELGAKPFCVRGLNVSILGFCGAHLTDAVISAAGCPAAAHPERLKTETSLRFSGASRDSIWPLLRRSAVRRYCCKSTCFSTCCDDGGASLICFGAPLFPLRRGLPRLPCPPALPGAISLPMVFAVLCRRLIRRLRCRSSIDATWLWHTAGAIRASCAVVDDWHYIHHACFSGRGCCAGVPSSAVSNRPLCGSPCFLGPYLVVQRISEHAACSARSHFPATSGSIII